MQVLEGGRDEVNALYNTHRARPAPRAHRAAALRGGAASATSRGWTMGHVNLCKINPSTLLKYSAKPALDPFAVSGRASLALLEELIATAQIVGRA